MYIKQLRLSLQGKTGPALQEEENKIKIVALRTTSNINAVIKVGQKNTMTKFEIIQVKDIKMLRFR